MTDLRRHLTAAAVTVATLAGHAAADSNFGCVGLEADTDLATLEGHDGVFYRMVSDLRVDLPFSDQTVADLADWSRALARRGTTLVFAPVPTKSAAMPGWLPERARLMGFDLELATEVHLDILRRLEAAGVVTADLRAGMLAGEPGRRTFFGTDTHWNAYGAELAAMAVAEVLRAQPGFADLTKTRHETVEAGQRTAFSGMRRILQRRCKETLPEPITMTYETRAVAGPDAIGIGLGEDAALDIGLTEPPVLDIGLDDPVPHDAGPGDTAVLDIGLDDAAPVAIGAGGAQDRRIDPADRLPVALVGTSFTDLAVSNFPGFLAQHTGVEVVNFAITGAGQYGAITSYLTSDDFQLSPPAFLVWEVPIYANLAQTGNRQMRELIAAADGRCSAPVAFEARADRLSLIADLPAGLGPDHTLFLDTDNRATAAATFRFHDGAGRFRIKSMLRGKRARLNGRFYMPMTGLWPDGATRVEIDFPIPLGSAPGVFACMPNSTDRKD